MLDIIFGNIIYDAGEAYNLFRIIPPYPLTIILTF